MSEQLDVQQPMIDYATEIGWEYVSQADALAMRGGDTGIYFVDVLRSKLIELNPGVVDEGRADEIIRQLNLLQTNIQGNSDALGWMRGERSVFVPSENRERNVRLIDFDNPGKNVFNVTDEWWQRSAVFRNRADVVFLINGIPVAVAETKYAGKPDGLGEAVAQIRRYHEETPEMVVATQVFGVTQMLDFIYGVTWSTNRKNLFNWKEIEPGNYEQKVKTFFDRERFLRTLRDYIIFVTENDELKKKLLRQHQTRAVEKVIERSHDPAKRRGLIWHTQGSGKTLTMVTIASKLLRQSGGEKFTVLMLVDRNELEANLFTNLSNCGISSVRVAGSKRELRRILSSDYRGLVVSMIHKFDDIPEKINERESIIVLVDEAHRTTSGDLGNYLMAALPNATYIGFTGTPIDRIHKGKGTFKVFGCEDETGYLDKYSIAESIEDGTTVKLHYAHGPSELQVDKELLEREFLSLAEAEGVSDVEELNAILDRAVNLRQAMKAPQRVDGIAQLVAQHFTENVQPMGFKAFLVGVDRTACALYKQALDKYLPPEQSVVVYSWSNDECKLIKEYGLTDDAEKQVRKDFIRKGVLPQILIVTEKLLTGFDAPILYCMYLDKPMRDHVLLQTIARVNRPYEDGEGLVKPCGLVFDFVGIFENLEKALAFDSDVVTSVIQNIDVLRRLFETLMRDTAPKYLPLTVGWGDKVKEKAIEHFKDKEVREEFSRFFRELQSLYDILTPDAFLRPFMDDYEALARLYGLIRQAYTPRPYVDRELTEKTKRLLQKHTEGLNFDMPGTVHELDKQALDAIRNGGGSDTTKILNLNKLFGEAMGEADGKPFLVPIGERAQLIMQQWEDRQVSTQEALEEFMKLAREYVSADEKRQDMKVDENTFAIYTALKPEIADLHPAQAVEIDAEFRRHPDYQWNEQEKRNLRDALYRMLLPIVGGAGGKFVKIANMLLKLKRI